MIINERQIMQLMSYVRDFIEDNEYRSCIDAPAQLLLEIELQQSDEAIRALHDILDRFINRKNFNIKEVTQNILDKYLPPLASEEISIEISKALKVIE